LARFKFKFRIVLFCFSFTFVSFGESRLLVSWCAGVRYGMMCNNDDRGRSIETCCRGPGMVEQVGYSIVSGREVEWRHVRSAPGTWRLGARVSWLSLKTKVDGL
jgi:hypothetical protein